MIEANAPDNPDVMNRVRQVSQYLSVLIPANHVPNETVADSSINCASVIRDLSWHNPACEALRDIKKFWGILEEDHYGIHYIQVSRTSDGRATCTAFTGWIDRELADAC